MTRALLLALALLVACDANLSGLGRCQAACRGHMREYSGADGCAAERCVCDAIDDAGARE